MIVSQFVQCIFIFGLISVKKMSDCIEIEIKFNGSAFTKSADNSSVREILFRDPLEYNLTVTASIGNLTDTKQLEISKDRTVVFADKTYISMQSNLDSNNFKVNTICTFYYDGRKTFLYDTVCCEVSLRQSNNSSELITKNFCKFALDSTTRECFTQLHVEKKQIDFRENDKYIMLLSSRVFSPRDSACSVNSVIDEEIAESFPTPIVVSKLLQVKSYDADRTQTFGELEINVPVDSIDPNIHTMIYLRIIHKHSWQKLNLACNFSDDIVLTALNFDHSRFEGKFKFTVNSHSATIALEMTEDRQQWNSTGEPLVNLVIKVNNARLYFSNDKKEQIPQWLSCKIVKGKQPGSKAAFREYEAGKPENVTLNVDYEGLIIIPRFEKKSIMSTLTPVHDPIILKQTDIKMYCVDDVKKGAYFDATPPVIECTSLTNSGIICPTASTKTGKGLMESKRNHPSWNIILSIRTWRKLYEYPIEYWEADDWRLQISSKILRKISGWSAPTRSGVACEPVYQTAKCHFLGRIFRYSVNQNRVYFGENENNKHPLLDFTSYLTTKNIDYNNSIFNVKMKKNYFLLTGTQDGQSDIFILNNDGKKLTVDRIYVKNEEVNLVNLMVTCIRFLNINQSFSRSHPNFRRIVIYSQEALRNNETCFLKVMLVFNDGSSVDFEDMEHADLQLKITHDGKTNDINDIRKFLYVPTKYKTPGLFELLLYGSEKCNQQRFLFSKWVNLYSPKVEPKVILPKSNAFTIAKTITSKPANSFINISQKDKSKSITESQPKPNIDTHTLFLTMKILIGLVGLVVVIIIVNCIIKFRNRKSARLLERHIHSSSVYGPVEKLTTSTYIPTDIPNQSQNNQHPPLLPPPGPLLNASDSSQLDLTVNATPDIFWGLPHSNSMQRKRISNTNMMNVQFHQMNNPDNSLNFSKIIPISNRTSPISEDFGYMTSAAPGKISMSKIGADIQNSFSFVQTNDNDSMTTVSSGRNLSCINVPPPCPPLRWNNNPYYSTGDFSVGLPLSQISNDQNSQKSLNPSHCSSWEAQPSTFLPPTSFSNSTDNICEKSSGLGSLTSTQPGSDCSKKECGFLGLQKNAHFESPH